jgi:copper oxidase (laccase) domain-containing protein
MPIPTRANAFIASPSIFTSEVMKDGITVMGKTYADGTFVPKGDAFAITSADCPTIVAWNSQKTHLAWAHAARDSLFDRASLVEGVSSREHFSVVHSLLDAFRGQGFLPEHVHVHVVCGIRTGFYHSRQNLMHGAYNKALLKMCEQYEGAIMDDALDEIDLYAVIRGQAIERHVPEANISVDSIDTFADTDGEGHHLWASARCPTRKNYRNLVLGYHRM